MIGLCLAFPAYIMSVMPRAIFSTTQLMFCLVWRKSGLRLLRLSLVQRTAQLRSSVAQLVPGWFALIQIKLDFPNSSLFLIAFSTKLKVQYQAHKKSACRCFRKIITLIKNKILIPSTFLYFQNQIQACCSVCIAQQSPLNFMDAIKSVLLGLTFYQVQNTGAKIPLHFLETASLK